MATGDAALKRDYVPGVVMQLSLIGELTSQTMHTSTHTGSITIQ